MFERALGSDEENYLAHYYLAYTDYNLAVYFMQKKETEHNIYIIDEMVKLSEELQTTIFQGNLSEFGNLLHEGWMHKKKLASNVTNTVIDSYYEKARDAGAMGGKILGSGGGGFLLLYCKKNYQDSVRQALSDLRETTFGFEPLGSRIIFVSD